MNGWHIRYGEHVTHARFCTTHGTPLPWPDAKSAEKVRHSSIRQKEGKEWADLIPWMDDAIVQPCDCLTCRLDHEDT